ncbi:MAG: N-6 DNA methylase [Geminicoccaceae bacterium]|nr:N-6 DNA methylase [Geminicoccaceae bacterium]
MSRSLIHKYRNDLSDLRRRSGSRRESVVREAFKDLLKGMGRARDLVFVPEHEIPTPQGRRYVDGALVDEVRIPFGYWEAKDEDDDLDGEIEAKLRRGYPRDNIVFEDSRTAVLYQHGHEVARCSVEDADALEKLLGAFFAFERPEIAGFRKAVRQFQADLPAVLGALRDMIEGQHAKNAAFRAAADAFLAEGQGTINPDLTGADVREMLIQHILTEEIFARVFGESDFHRHNNVARQLYALEEKFFRGNVKWQTLKGLEPYYAAIRAAAARISSHHEKQKFLKAVYENFYKVYNPKAADRLGVVYTPNEIVRFMIEGADHLCREHFGKGLIDRGVEILDPATGTGTFVTELIEYFRGQKDKLRHKYLEELHANEVAILPYYVANLNIEATYAAIAGEYLEYPNLCFVDTLDNVAALKSSKGKTDDLFGAVSEENVARIERQNARRISVVIGNPPYNANQLNENENNKNRAYPEIDRRIKATYVRASNAQKTKLYDMYVRFFRWASDRVDENGIVAFVTSRSFVERLSADGFRKEVARDFNEIVVVDLGGDARDDLKLSGSKHNVFGIRTGVAISFLVRRRDAQGCRIRYTRRPQDETAEEKLAFLGANRLADLRFETIEPDADDNWLNVAENDFESFLPIATNETKTTKLPRQEQAIFKLFSLGVNTSRDEWLYAHDVKTLKNKVKHFVREYEKSVKLVQEIKEKKDVQIFQSSIKWSRTLKLDAIRGHTESFDSDLIVGAAYRPFTKRYLYESSLFIDEIGAAQKLFPPGKENAAIAFSHIGTRTKYCILAIKGIADLHFGSAVDIYQQAPRYRYTDGQRIDNITDWALRQFQDRYGARGVTKDAIFRYVYGVLHDPVYRETYAQNLKRSFPRIPFYADFGRWAAWGEDLMGLHLGYETVEPWPLKRVDVPGEGTPRVVLKALKDEGVLVLDGETRLSGVPAEAWGYVLGNRTAVDWVLDQHKEKTPKDPTIREKFDTYRFADHKERVIDLLGRVVRVSVETVAVTEAMRGVPIAERGEGFGGGGA